MGDCDGDTRENMRRGQMMTVLEILQELLQEDKEVTELIVAEVDEDTTGKERDTELRKGNKEAITAIEGLSIIGRCTEALSGSQSIPLCTNLRTNHRN